ncbi:MAG: hypothetical protein U0L73_12875 [Ruminococcus bromii]|nr:hypothetical protein [Ruminococcus bromii]
MLIRHKNKLMEIISAEITTISQINIKAICVITADANKKYIITGEHTHKIIESLETNKCTNISKYDMLDYSTVYETYP